MLFHNSKRLNQVVFGVMYDIRYIYIYIYIYVYIHLTDCHKNKYLHRKQKLSNYKSLVEICMPKQIRS